MDLTGGTRDQKIERAKKIMLWFGMASIIMMFAGLTSAYVVSKNRPDWGADFQLPDAMYWSTLVIVLSSITLLLAKKSISVNKRTNATAFLIATLLLGITFMGLQFVSFSEIIKAGYYFTGSESNITTSFIYVVVLAHLAHLAVGLIVLLVVIYNHFKQHYHPGQMLGIELGSMFWHFLDILWVYLFLFLYFFR